MFEHTVFDASSPDTVVISLIGLIVLAIFFLFRYQKNLVWLPILAVFQSARRMLPRLVWRRPPLLSWLAFLVSLLALVLFSTKPKDTIYEEPPEGRWVTQLFLDFSPSVGEQITKELYLEKVQQVLAAGSNRGTVNLATSLSSKIHVDVGTEEVEQLFATADFHRPGLKLGRAVAALLKRVDEPDHLIIFADRDEHSWSDFNWRYLQTQMRISRVSLEADEGRPTNIFVDDVQVIEDSPDLSAATVGVELVRTGDVDNVQSVRLQGTVADRIVAKATFSFARGEARERLQVALPKDQMTSIDPLFNKRSTDSKAILVKWQIVPIQASKDNAMVGTDIDNTFYSVLAGGEQPVINLVGGNFGEGFIDEPASSLAAALRIQNLNVKQYDRWNSENIDFGASLTIILGGGGLGVNDFCPDKSSIMDLGRGR